MDRSDIINMIRQYIRGLLIACNIFFALTGAIILSVGVLVKQNYHDYNTFLDDKYAYAADLLILTGLIIFVIASFGCCGALKENSCMTKTYASLLVIILILELFVGISGVLLKVNTEDMVTKTLNDTIHEYGKKDAHDFTFMWDVMQKNFNCCGIYNYTDWLEKSSATSGLIPMSCCDIPLGAVGNFTCDSSTSTLAHEGCLSLFTEYVHWNSVTVQSVGLTLAVIQFIGILLACYLAKHVNSDYEAV